MARLRVLLDDDAWAAVRVAYEATPEPVTRILARFGIQRHQLYDRIALENWRMRSAGVVKSVADVPSPVTRPPVLPAEVIDAQTTAADVARDLGHVSIAIEQPAQTHEQRLERLHRIIDQLLVRLESTMARNPNMTPQDQEKTARAVSQAVTAIQRVIDLGDPKKALETPEGGKTNDSAEAERMRREIAERLERLSARLLDGPAQSE